MDQHLLIDGKPSPDPVGRLGKRSSHPQASSTTTYIALPAIPRFAAQSQWIGTKLLIGLRQRPGGRHTIAVEYPLMAGEKKFLFLLLPLHPAARITAPNMVVSPSGACPRPYALWGVKPYRARADTHN